MKNGVIGGILYFVGSIVTFAIIVMATQGLEETDHLLRSVREMGLTLPLVLAAAALFAGLYLITRALSERGGKGR